MRVPVGHAKSAFHVLQDTRSLLSNCSQRPGGHYATFASHGIPAQLCATFTDVVRRLRLASRDLDVPEIPPSGERRDVRGGIPQIWNGGRPAGGQMTRHGPGGVAEEMERTQGGGGGWRSKRTKRGTEGRWMQKSRRTDREWDGGRKDRA